MEVISLGYAFCVAKTPNSRHSRVPQGYTSIKAGTQAALQASAENLDSRLRGNDDRLANSVVNLLWVTTENLDSRLRGNDDGLANSVVNMRRKRLTE